MRDAEGMLPLRQLPHKPAAGTNPIHLPEGARDNVVTVYQCFDTADEPINRLDEIAADRELHARGMLYSVRAFETAIRQVGPGIHIDESSEPYRSPPPGLGEHMDAVPRELLGVDEERLIRLREQNII